MKRLMFLFSALFLFSAHATSAQTDPPTNLSYKHNPVTFDCGFVSVPDTAVVTGMVDSFTVAPDLPAGLSLDKTTGIISGIPETAVPKTTYIITAQNGAGSTTVSLSITVAILPEPPITLVYSTNPATYTMGREITPNTPSTSGSPPDSYTVTPALPAGLTLNRISGVITGTPTAATAMASYKVTAFLKSLICYGPPTCNLSITVIDPSRTMSPLVLSSRGKVGVFDANNSNIVLRYVLPDKCQVSVKYYDLKGHIIASFIDKMQSSGYYSLPLNVSSWPKGVYIQDFRAGKFEKKEIIILAR